MATSTSHLLRIAAMALAAALGGSACGDEDPECTELCVGELAFTFADGREEYEAVISGTGFSVTLQCPAESFEGNVYGLELTCDDATFVLGIEEADFPSELTVIEDEDRWDLVPEYDTVEQCGSPCESGEITLD